MSRPRTERRPAVAGVLIVLGLAVQAVSLQGIGPGPFLAFLLVGSTAVVAGVALFLWHLAAVLGFRSKP